MNAITNKPYSNIEVLKKEKEVSNKGIQILYDLETLNEGQKRLSRAINSSAVVVAIGKSGVGKTLLTAIDVVKLLKEHKTRKLIFSRPKISLENDSKGGLATFHKYLEQILGADKLEEYLASKKIQELTVDEVRLITYKNTTLIVDQSQFASKYELYTFLSRAGKGSKTIILGDLDVICPDKSYRATGLAHLVKRIHESSIELDYAELALIQFEDADVVRNPSLNKIYKLLQ